MSGIFTHIVILEKYYGKSREKDGQRKDDRKNQRYLKYKRAKCDAKLTFRKSGAFCFLRIKVKTSLSYWENHEILYPEKILSEILETWVFWNFSFFDIAFTPILAWPDFDLFIFIYHSSLLSCLRFQALTFFRIESRFGSPNHGFQSIELFNVWILASFGISWSL